MSRAFWEQARDNGQRQVDFANSILDPPEDVAEASIGMSGMDGLEVTTRMQTESDMRWLLDNRLEKGLITPREAREAFADYSHYLDAVQSIPNDMAVEDRFNEATQEMIRTGRLSQSEGDAAMHDFKMSRMTSPRFYQ